ncbi:MAG: Photosynthesis system assembly factor [Nocardioidaceae bacterium]|nr:Photosynthesis system assembly factor [Nocardioidaceae bacterium]
MTDLETRIRDGLHDDLTQPDVDRFLTGVRRGVARRRGRRASAGVAALVAAVIGGSVLLQHGHDHRTPPQPITHGPSPTRAADTTGRVDDLDTAGGEVYRLTSDLGCSACSSVWRRDPSGSWTHLYDFAGRAAYGGHPSRHYGPVDSLTMAPNGRDGWADGHLLWATHDGGNTWSVVEEGPGARTIYGRDVAVGTHVAWAMRHRLSGGTLWRTTLGSDSWQRVDGVPRIRDVVRFAGVTADDRVALQVSGEGGSGNALVVGTPGDWTQTSLPSSADVVVRTDGTTFWASQPEPRGIRMFRLEGGHWADLGRFAASSWLPLDADRVLLDQPTAIVSFLGAPQPTDLPRGARILAVSRASDATFWLLATGRRVFSSTDALHWTPQP